MKLRTKIQISFCVTIAIILVIISEVVSKVNQTSSMETVNESLKTTASLASNYISQQLEDYMNAVSLVGKEEILSGNAKDEEKMAYLDSYVNTYGFTSGNILNKDGVSINDGTDFSDRDYVKLAMAGTTNISDITLSKYTGTYGVSIASPIKDPKEKIVGVVYFRLDINFINDILENIKISDNSYAYMVDGDANVVVHPNEELIMNYNLKEQGKALSSLANKIMGGETGNGSYTNNGKEIICGYAPIRNTSGWSVVIATQSADFMSATYRVKNALVVLLIVSLIIGFMVAAVIATSVSKPIENVRDVLLSISEGDLSVKVSTSQGKNEVAILQNATASLHSTLSKIIGQANSILGSIAKCDLTANNMDKYPGEFDSLAESINTIKRTLNQLIKEVQNSVQSVDVGSSELAQATSALSQGTVTQASSIQALADNLGIVVDRINRNSENGERVNEQLAELDGQIHSANVQMEELLAAVDEIETMSSSIKKIVATIDGIAFQTNILSLNASVEAARAGEMGAGFAVVAEEVRNLAEKCSESSKRTSDLITDCIKSISNAKVCADATFGSLSGIVNESTKIAEAFQEISKDTIEQANKSKHIQEEINNISDVIQTNTATVEETAAATAVLSEQAMNLEDMVKAFKITK